MAIRDDLQVDLIAVLGAARELPAEDQAHLADIFLHDLEAHYRLVPRDANPSWGEGFDGIPTGLTGSAAHSWRVLAVTVVLLIALSLTLFDLVPPFLSFIIHMHLPTLLLLLLLILVIHPRSRAIWRRSMMDRFAHGIPPERVVPRST